MEELINISIYSDEDNNQWFRVKILLHNDVLIFDVFTLPVNNKKTLMSILSVSQSIIRYDNAYFDSLCNDENIYYELKTDKNRINKFVENNTLKDLDNDAIEIIFSYGD